MRRWPIRVGALTVLLAVSANAACTLLEPLDGLTGGPSDGSDANDGAPSDGARVDGQQPGADARTDARPDADDGGVDAPAGDGSWCALNAKGAAFCEDFDLAGLSRFDGMEQVGGAPMLVTVDPLSPPNALLSAGAGPGELRIGVEHGSPVMTSAGTLAIDIRLEKINTAGNQPAQLMKLIFSLGAASYEVGVGAAGTTNDRYVYTYATPSTNYAVVARGGQWPMGAWVRVTMHVTLATDGGTVDVDFAGTPLATAVPIMAPFASASVTSEVGIAFANAGSNGWTARMDNLVYDSK